MTAELQALGWIAGRFLLGGLFVVGGVQHFFSLETLSQAIAARGLPAPKAVLVFGSLFQIICGLAFVIGLYVQWAAIGLILFTLLASVLLINFWDMAGAARETAVRNWQSNVAIIGGLMIAAAYANG
jgi:putative oxidoreductase